MTLSFNSFRLGNKVGENHFYQSFVFQTSTSNQPPSQNFMAWKSTSFQGIVDTMFFPFSFLDDTILFAVEEVVAVS